MRVILDTNVFISGIFFTGPPYQILKAWRDGEVQLLVSPSILDEYQRIGTELALHIVSEGVIDQVKQVADGVANVNEKLDRRFNELRAEIDNKTQPIAQAVLELSGKVAALDGRVVALDGKVDRIHEELKTEIKETRQEVLAAVKFSYAELDKRITTLEKEFLELKHRVEKIETRSVS
jgi:putative PIN family toxin of toxin-antitoxin system